MEDAVTAGANQAGDHEEDEPEQDLALDQLDDPDDGDDGGNEKEQHVAAIPGRRDGHTHKEDREWRHR